MKLLFKKMLVNILVLMVVMLPLRSVFAMPMTMSPDHCVVDTAEVEMAMMDHAGHNMPSSNLQDTQQEQEATACVCCDQCDGECTGCVHISSAITFDFLQLSDIRTTELVSVITDSLLTRTLSPPSRPPLTL